MYNKQNKKDMLVTKEDYTVDFMNYGSITVPKGTKLTNNTACGIDENYNFVDDLSWIESYVDGTKQYGLIHDMKYYGLNVPKEYVEHI